MLMGPRNVLVSRQRQLNTLKFPIQEYTNYGLLVHLKPWIGAEDTERGEFSKNPRSTLPTNTPVIHSSGFGKPVITTDTTSTTSAYTRLLHSEGTGRGLCTRLVRVFKLYYLTF